MTAVPAIDLIEAGAALVAGAALIWFPGRYRRRAERHRAERIAELRAGAEETYFEETRALEAYPVPGRDWHWRLIGALLIAFGGFLVLDYFS